MSSSSLNSPATETQAQCHSAVNVANFVSAKLCRRDENSNNYRSWKEQMMCLVESQGLVAFLDGKAPPPPTKSDDGDYAAWRRTDRLLKGWILGALSDELVQTVLYLDSARDVWLELENSFTKPKFVAPPPPPPQQAQKDWHDYLPLYKAALNGDWDKAKAILDEDPDAVKARVAHTLETALHIAVAVGKSTSFVTKLVNMMSNDSLAIPDHRGRNPLHVAAWLGNLPAVELLVRRHPDLLYVPNYDGYFPIQLAADAGHRQTLEFLIENTRDDLHTSPFASTSGLVLLNFLIDVDFFDMALDLVVKYPYLAKMQPNSGLKRIALKGTIFSPEAQLNVWERLVYSSIQLEVELPTMQLQSTDIENQTCFVLLLHGLSRWHTLLAKLRSTIWKLIIQLVPRTKKIYEKKLMHEQALRLVKWLCKHMESLTYTEASPVCRDALLTAARLGVEEVIEEIVHAIPPAIYSIDAATKQNFLHLAVQNRCETVFNLLYQAGKHSYYYTDIVDASGNSILHLAASLAPPHKLNLVSGAALQMQREIQWFKEADKFVSPYIKEHTNNAGKTAEMIFTEEHRELKVEGEKWMKDTANSCTIAAALIATVVFAAAITVPGGNESSGYPMFGKSSAFTIFAVSDAISLFTSTTSLLMFLSILTSRYAEEDFLYALPKRLCIGLVTLFLSILFMMAAFSSTLYLVFGRKQAWVLIPVAALTCLPITSFVLLQFPLLIAVISSTYGRGIFGKQSDRPFH